MPPPLFSEIIQVVELVVPRCSLSFGVGACTASLADGPYCFQQWGGCLKRAAFNDLATIKWRFMKKTARAMRLYEEAGDVIGTDPFYMLEGVSINESRINIGSVRQGDAPLGITGGVSLTFRDEPFDDHVGDPYRALRGASPSDAGFWAQFFTRVPYFAHITINVYEGSWGTPLSAMDKRTYLMESGSGPDSSGLVSITGVDPLRLTDPKRASFPPEMDSQLVTNMVSPTATTDIVVQRGITGDFELVLGNTSTKYILIGKEILGYTGQTEGDDGEWTLTGITRAQLGTTGSTHKPLDAVQRVGYFYLMDSWEIAEFLCGFTPIPGAFVNVGGDWETEANTYLTGYQFTRAVVKPTAVNKLLGELMRDSTFYLWWDATASQIKMKAIKPEEATGYIDDDNYIRGSFRVTREPGERMSRVHIRFDQRDPTQGAAFTNYAQSAGRVSTEDEYEKAGATVVSQVIYSDWIISKPIADEVTLRLLARFAQTPVYASVRVVGDDIKTGDVIEVVSPSLRDTEGFKVSRKWQVISDKSVKPKEVTELTLQEFIFQAARYMVWMADDAGPYEDIPELIGVGYWSGDDGLMSDGSEGWLWQ